MATIINGVRHTDHEDIKNMVYSVLTPEEISEIEFNTQIVGAMIEAREKQGITQKELERISGVSQPLIARIEKSRTSPRVSTILRILEPLGMTLKVVPKNK